MTEKLPTVTTIYPPGSWGEDLESAKQWIVNNLDWAVPALIILVIVAVIALRVWLWVRRKKSAASNPANQKQGNDNNHSPQIAASGSGATVIQQYIYNTGLPPEEHAKVLAKNTELERQLEQARAAATAVVNSPNTSDVLRQTLTKASDLLQQGKMTDLQKLLQPIEQEQTATIAAIQDMIAVSYMATKDFLNAEIYYRKAYNIQPDSHTHAHNLGWVLSEQHKYSEALICYEQAEKIARKEPQNPQELAMTLNNLGNLHRDMGRFEEAKKAYMEALQLGRALAKTNPDAYNPNLAGTLNGLGNLHLSMEKFEEAGEAYTEALQLYRALAKTDPDAYNPDLAGTLTNLGTLHRAMERFEEAKKAYTEALQLDRALAKSNPDAYNPNLAMTLNNLGVLHGDRGNFDEAFDEAEEAFREALQLCRALAKTNPDAYNPSLARTLNNLGVLYRDGGRLDEAKEALGKEAFGEALQLYHALAKQYPDAYNPSLKKLENNIAKLEQLKKQQEAA
ncbi:MAG: tetratricopeptide repeat protein [Holosporaceae bacterium]